jgi:hypothetical protein
LGGQHSEEIQRKWERGLKMKDESTSIKRRKHTYRETLTNFKVGIQNISIKKKGTRSNMKDNARKYGRKENKDGGTEEDTDKSGNILIL